MTNRETDSETRETSVRVAEFLRQPQAYPAAPADVEEVETHISRIFLTDRFAYKLKKPVRFDFLDFSTLEKRQWACEEEVRLNRRLAPEVYLGVVPVVSDQHRELSLGGEGVEVDYLVQMQRLPANRSLDQLIGQGELAPADCERVAALLASFYRQLDPLPIQPGEYRTVFERHIRENRQTLLDAASELDIDASGVKRTHAKQLHTLVLNPRLFDRRAGAEERASRIVDGHGDLRAEHVYLLPEPVIIDAIEFNGELRQVDVADELCFLEMECELLGDAAFGRDITSRCLQALADDPPRMLLDFYKAYRACVRAKVTMLRAQQLNGNQRQQMAERSRRYVELADSYGGLPDSRLLVLVRGLMGTGKSTLASALSESLGAELLQTDVLRRERFGASDQAAGYNQGLYDKEHRMKVYEEMFSRAETLLQNGLPVVLDGTFLSAEWRLEAIRRADRHGASPWVVVCRCPQQVAIARIEARQQAGRTYSEARSELFERQRQDEDPDPPGLPVLEVDTTEDVPSLLSEVVGHLQQAVG